MLIFLKNKTLRLYSLNIFKPSKLLNLNTHPAYLLHQMHLVIIELPVLPIYGGPQQGPTLVGDGQATGVLVGDQVLDAGESGALEPELALGKK